METLNPAPKLDHADLVAEHNALHEMYVADKAADAITPDDATVYSELVADNREQLKPKPLIVEFKNSGPQEIPVSRKIGGRAIDETARQVRNDSWR